MGLWVFLGVLYDLRNALKEAYIVADAKPGRRASILATLNVFLATLKAFVEDMDRLRGKSGFLATTTFGRMGRAPEQVLEYLAEEVEPLLELHKDLAQAESDVRV